MAPFCNVSLGLCTTHVLRSHLVLDACLGLLRLPGTSSILSFGSTLRNGGVPKEGMMVGKRR